jgi:DNA-binding GntR family transcriptional regulator
MVDSGTDVTPELETDVRESGLRVAAEAHVLAAIRSGQLRPGERVREVEIARTLGTSLTPVREALFRLTHDGVLAHRPRRGFFLAELPPEEMKDVYLFRATIEGLAASLAATRIQAAELATLERLIQMGEVAARAGDVLTNVECNAQFHATIMKAARHRLVERAWRLLAPLQWLPRAVAATPPMTPPLIDDWVARHRRILAAVQLGDPVSAERIAREHVLEAGRLTISRLERPAGRS